jgi:hypothetical protein
MQWPAFTYNTRTYYSVGWGDEDPVLLHKCTVKVMRSIVRLANGHVVTPYAIYE